MTQQEEQLIDGLMERVSSTRLAEKDADAERKLQNGLGRNPDALYILAQTALVQQMALEQVQRQLADLRAQQQEPRKATSFLGSIFGHDEPARPAPPPPPQFQAVPGTGPQSSYGGAGYAPAGYGSSPFGYGGPGAGQSGGFLRGALQTATGVAAGALAFEGIESLLHGFGSGTGSRGFGDLGGGRPEEVINNYYGDSGRDPAEGGLSPDIEDRRGDAGYDSGDRVAATDDTGFGGDDLQSGGDDTGSDSDDAFDSGGDDSFGGDGDLGGGGDDFGGGGDSF